MNGQSRPQGAARSLDPVQGVQGHCTALVVWRRVCAFPLCGRPIKNRGLCRGHASQYYRKQPLTPLRWSRAQEPRTCSFPGCGRRHSSRGLCGGHRRQQLLGKALVPIRPERPPICTFPGCGRPHDQNRLCSSHNNQRWRGQPLTPLGSTKPIRGICVIKGCGLPHSALGFCRNHHRIGLVFNLTAEQYEAKLQAQGHACAICREPFGDKAPHIDHNRDCCPGYRSCGKCVRDLLCGTCNPMLGQGKDNPEVLQAGAVYLVEQRDLLGELLAAQWADLPDDQRNALSMTFTKRGAA